MNSNTLSYKVCGLDCVEEVRIIKSALATSGYSEDDLAFDLVQGKLTVETQGRSGEDLEIVKSIAATGMEAVSWADHLLRVEGDEGFWEEHGRMVFCCLGGVLNVLALVWHATLYGWRDAFGGIGEPHTYPLLSILSIGAAVLISFWFVLPKAWYALKNRRADMNLLMVAAVVGAIFLGEWMEAGMVAFLFAVSLQLEAWSVRHARHSISGLLASTPDTALVFCDHDRVFEAKPSNDVRVGARVQVRPGDRIPLDGEVVEGESHVNQAPITGESKPVSVEVGSSVYAGSINGNGTLELCTTKTAEHSTLSRMIALVQDAQSKRSKREAWVERFAGIYTPTVMGLSLLIMVTLPLLNGGDWMEGVYQGLVLLVIACPCALVISTPITIVSSLSAAARNGVLIKGGTVLDRAATITVVATDKTGTLTMGDARVQSVFPLNDHTGDEVLGRAAAMEVQSPHPIAIAILKEARERNLAVPECVAYQIVQGKGATGQFNDHSFWIGSMDFAGEQGVDVALVQEAYASLDSGGDTVVVVGHEAHVCGLIRIADGIRSGAKEMVQALHQCGIESVVMLTGDAEGPARAVAAGVGVDDLRFELLPEEKVGAVLALGENGAQVAMLGDGINDAPAMAAASMGIAMGAMGSDAAIETADVALVSDDLSNVPWLFQHSKRTMRILKQNIIFALGIKVIFVLLAISGISTLWMAIVADMGGSLAVIFNGLRLLRNRS